MSGTRVLIVDDEVQALRLLGTALSARGYDVTLAANGEAAVTAIGQQRPDVIILDLVMPGMSGLDVCRWVCERMPVPVIVLSARGEERDKVAALDLGADDYLTKPFGMEELLARLRVALRRASQSTGPAGTGFSIGNLRIDFVQRRVWRSDDEVRLTPTEYDLLRFLVEHPDKVLTHGAILRAVWGPGYERESQYLRVFIPQLRRKLEPDPARPRYILTDPGVGYRFQTTGDA